ncbi:hypothetical protein [Streptomyces sp. HUAS ZL42]|uniref:hypothetical protein n=1 Tax=Streptomyces sp. HUAS ZL42 TaxID=3231715 RepID=UPI00345E699A
MCSAVAGSTTGFPLTADRLVAAVRSPACGAHGDDGQRRDRHGDEQRVPDQPVRGETRELGWLVDGIVELALSGGRDEAEEPVELVAVARRVAQRVYERSKDGCSGTGPRWGESGGGVRPRGVVVPGAGSAPAGAG